MKQNRKKFTVFDVNPFEQRPKRKIGSSFISQRNLAFLESYNNAFRKQITQFGDAETFFKRSLRNSKDFDLISELKLRRLVKSQRLAKEEKGKVAQRFSDTVLETQAAEVGEVEVEESFYSPYSEGDRKSVVTESEAKLSETKSCTSFASFEEENREETGQFESLEHSEKNQEVQQELQEQSYVYNTSDLLQKEAGVPKSFNSLQIIEEKEETVEEMEDGEDLMTDNEYGEAEPEEQGDEPSDNLGEVTDESDYKISGQKTGKGEDETENAEEEEGEELEMKKVEHMISQTSKELQQLADQSQQLLDKDTKSKTPEAEFFKFDGNIDGEILKELEDTERQAKKTAKAITDLKNRISELMKKEKMTENEAKELESINRELKYQMKIFEEKTRRIQCLLAQANLFEDMTPICVAQKQHVDTLPKVLCCGINDTYMPKIIVCDGAIKDVKDEPKPKHKDLRKLGVKISIHQKHRSPCRPPQMQSMGMPPQGEQIYNMMDQGYQDMSKYYQMPMQGQFQEIPQMQLGFPPMNMAQQVMPVTLDKNFPFCPAFQNEASPPYAQKLTESYCMQEMLAAENANLEGKRYQLQTDLMNKDQTVENLQKQLVGLQTQMRMMCKENQLLTDKAQPLKDKKCPTKCGKGYGPCPAELENKLQECSDTTQQLESQLASVEDEVKMMQQELQLVQKEREHLEQHRKMLSTPCVPPPCQPPPCMPPHVCQPPPQTCSDTAIRELKEKYHRLEDDFKNKLTEVSYLRTENQKLKQAALDVEEGKKVCEAKLKEMERDLQLMRLSCGKGISKESMMELEQQLTVAKQRWRDAQDELDELRALIEDQKAQMDNYRTKYLDAQQTVEEQSRQIEMMEIENQRICQQLNLEIQRVKNQFQEKLQELEPLPEILKSTQTKLQEAQQMHILAERNNEALCREIQMYKDRMDVLNIKLSESQSNQLNEDERSILNNKLAECELKVKQMEEEAMKLRESMEKLEKINEENEHRIQEKMHEITQLEAQLDNVREESARQVTRTKERCETVRKCMQNQINDMEHQLAQCRASAKAAQRERDEIRQKMQAQINNLNENFEDAQMRIKNLQANVNFLKNSAGTVLTTEFEMSGMTCTTGDFKDDPCNCSLNF